MNSSQSGTDLWCGNNDLCIPREAVMTIVCGDDVEKLLIDDQTGPSVTLVTPYMTSLASQSRAATSFKEPTLARDSAVVVM